MTNDSTSSLEVEYSLPVMEVWVEACGSEVQSKSNKYFKLVVEATLSDAWVVNAKTGCPVTCTRE